MATATTADSRWQQLNSIRQSLLTRCERYAMFTLPKLFPPTGYNQNSDELTHDYQAVGAQAVNHLTNKLMLALFAPSQPFFRCDPTKKLRELAAEVQMTEGQLVNILAEGEKAAVAELDKLAMRPKLHEVLKNLIVLGNVLLILEKDSARVVGLKNYVARRSNNGKLLELLVCDRVLFDELEPEVQDALPPGYQPDTEVSLYHWIKRDRRGDYVLTQWVDKHPLPDNFSGKWPEAKLPYRALTWDLADKNHYGTGLVEDYNADFAGLSVLSRAQVMGAVLASEFRWLVNPAGMTKPEDFENSENGAAIPGAEGDVTLVQSGKSGDLQVTMAMTAEYVNRIGRGFLMGAAVTRNAERVTAEEIRMTANELETSLGGVYSRLAADCQLPLARWLLGKIGLTVNNNIVEPTVVTGLEALSRSRDLEDLKLWIADLAGLAALPEALQAALDMGAIAVALALPRRIKAEAYLKSAAQRQAEAEAAQAAEMEANAAQAGVNAAAQVAVNQSKQGPQ